MQEFKVGDEVKLNPTSRFNDGSAGSPLDTKGVVTEIGRRYGYPVRVDWSNGAFNCYYDEGLLPWIEAPKKVYRWEVEDPNGPYEDRLAEVKTIEGWGILSKSSEGAIVLHNKEGKSILTTEFDLVDVPSEKWEPKGGPWYIDVDGGIDEYPSCEACRKFGMTRATKEQVETHRERLQPFNVVWAFIDEHEVQGEATHLVTWCATLDKYRAINSGPRLLPWIPSGPKQVIEELCEKLNSGEIEI